MFATVSLNKQWLYKNPEMISLKNFRSSREWEYVKNLVFNLKYEFFIKIVYSVFKVSTLLYSYLKKMYIVSLKPNFHS